MSQPELFKTIALIGRHDDERIAESLQSVAEHLLRRGREVCIDRRAARLSPQATHLTEQELAKKADLIVAVGGDGTMLHAARHASGANIPLLGVNRGRLGFLADISPADVSARLDEVLAGKFEREERRMLSATLHRADAPLTSVALNDVVLQKWDTGRILEFETWIDGRYVNTHGGDGLIVATATGSTAYALSCGGPILHPNLAATVLVPVCPHTLSDRPIAINSNAQIEIRLLARHETKAQVTCDGTMLGDFTAQDKLIIGPAARPVVLLHPVDHDYYKVLRSKLHWGRRGQEPERN